MTKPADSQKNMPEIDDYTQSALTHVRYISKTIGGRGSCTPAERRSAEYTAEQMRAIGVQDARLEPYHGAPSTYRPYSLAFAAALLGTLGAWLFPGRGMLTLAALFSALGAWGMLAETDFADNWTRWLLPKAPSLNAVGVIPPSGQVQRRAVLCAHLDTHRTPVFYSSQTWQSLFGVLVGGAFLGMVIGAVAYSLGALLGWAWVRWIGLAVGAVEAFALVMCLHADLTPYSPGANDNASGVGVTLGLARRLTQKPLARTEVWLAFTGCEETSAYGMAAFLDTHAAELGDQAVYIILDQVGLGRIEYLTRDGLILKRATHPRALELARRASAALLDLEVGEQVGIAYTDALVATKRGLIALSVNALPRTNGVDDVYWHQMSDTVEHIDPLALSNAHTFTWQVLQEIDRA